MRPSATGMAPPNAAASSGSRLAPDIVDDENECSRIGYCSQGLATRKSSASAGAASPQKTMAADVRVLITKGIFPSKNVLARKKKVA